MEVCLGEAVGKLYVEKRFPPKAKQRMDQMVKNVLEAYRARFEKLDWMSPATKEKALAKLAMFTPKIGYPKKWRDYSALEIRRGDLVGNLDPPRSTSGTANWPSSENRSIETNGT